MADISTNLSTEERFASVSWLVGDVQSLAPSLSDEAAADWLRQHESSIRDRLVERGWGVIETLLQASGISLDEPEDELKAFDAASD